MQVLVNVRVLWPQNAGHGSICWCPLYAYVCLHVGVVGFLLVSCTEYTRGSAMAEGPRDAVVSRNSVTTKQYKHPI